MRRGVRVCAAVALAAVIGVSGCAKKKPAPPQPTPPPPAETPRTTPTAPPPPPPAPAPREEPRAMSEEEIFARKSIEDLNKEGVLADTFFALDSSQVSDEGRGTLQKNADWMKRWASTRILVEGHGDSRGTAEYNLALGERRASAVRDYLVNLGIPAARIQIVSKGKEAPFCGDENEGCWQQNRRGHFVITAK